MIVKLTYIIKTCVLISLIIGFTHGLCTPNKAFLNWKLVNEKFEIEEAKKHLSMNQVEDAIYLGHNSSLFFYKDHLTKGCRTQRNAKNNFLHYWMLHLDEAGIKRFKVGRTNEYHESESDTISEE